jgi:DNA polymerase III epsilon subunit-like protein
MRRVLLLDTETTGTDESAQCIEVAAAVFDIRYAVVVRAFSSLLCARSNEAECVNQIPAQALLDAPGPAATWIAVSNLAVEAEAIVAHGAEFDRRFVPSDAVPSAPWICSMDDLLWPRARKPGESLVSLALAHGLGVCSAHRALDDVELLARLLARVHEMGADLDAFLARGLRPKARFVVADRRFDPARNEMAKAAGFKWDPDAREWWRVMAVEDASVLPFEVRQC